VQTFGFKKITVNSFFFCSLLCLSTFILTDSKFFYHNINLSYLIGILLMLALFGKRNKVQTKLDARIYEPAAC
jgi:hypothetical protein